MRRSAASASASGVDREPGENTAWRTPWRTHSSTSVAQNVAAAVTGTAPSSHPGSPAGHRLATCLGLTVAVDDTLPVVDSGASGAAVPGRRVALLHGFTQTARCWGPFGAALARSCRTLAVDMPGHGAAGAVRADLPATADLAVATVGPATYLGYSMGGRVALHAALRHPAAVEALVVIGATPGLVSPAERAERRAADARLAERIVEIGVDAFLDEWLQGPLFASLDPAASCRDERATNTAAGLAASLTLCGTGSQEPLWDALGRLAGPVLVVAGAADERFADIGARMVAAIGAGATLATVEDAGHAAHLEQPEATAEVVLSWLGGL